MSSQISVLVLLAVLVLAWFSYNKYKQSMNAPPPPSNVNPPANHPLQISFAGGSPLNDVSNNDVTKVVRNLEIQYDLEGHLKSNQDITSIFSAQFEPPAAPPSFFMDPNLNRENYSKPLSIFNNETSEAPRMYASLKMNNY